MRPNIIDHNGFATISSVDVANASSWDRRSFLTFDIDWAHDEVIADSLDLVEKADIAATWFATHDTPLLHRIRENPKFELGVHPNFLPLLMQGSQSNGANAEEVLDRLLAIVPEARSVRAHSLVQSGRLLQLFRAKGLTHEASCFLPAHSEMVLRPWVDWFGMVRVPYFWEDDFWCEAQQNSELSELEARKGIRGYDFHPIHIFLNSETMARYEGARSHFAFPERLREHRNSGDVGVRGILERLFSNFS